MTKRHRVQYEQIGVQLEIVEQPYRQQLEHPTVEVTVWESIDSSYTLLFEEVDIGRSRLKLAGPLLGTVPRVAVNALEDLGYTVSTETR